MKDYMEVLRERIDVLMFLVDEYNMKIAEQRFYTGGTYIEYSFYNESGCFTVSFGPCSDLDFYFAPKFSNLLYELHYKLVNIWIDEPEIWKRHQKWIWFIKDPFFWGKPKKIINALAETIRTKIERDNEFFGVQVLK